MTIIHDKLDKEIMKLDDKLDETSTADQWKVTALYAQMHELEGLMAVTGTDYKLHLDLASAFDTLESLRKEVAQQRAAKPERKPEHMVEPDTWGQYQAAITYLNILNGLDNA